MTDDKINTYRLLVPHERCGVWKSHSPKSIAKHQHLYTYFSGANDTDEIERWLDREFENPATIPISKVVNESRLTPGDWRHLFRFALAQSVRTPAGLQSFIRRQNETLEALIAETLESSLADIEAALKAGLPLKPAPPDESLSKMPLKVFRAKTEDGAEGIKAQALNGRKMWICQLRHVLTQTIHRLPRYRWTILHAPPTMSWPTTDNPFIRLACGADGGLSLDGGWGVPGVQLLLPLSPKHLLYACVGAKPPSRGTVLDESFARLFREAILRGANRYVFATDTAEIDKIRPRKVSAEQCEAEAQMWATWHDTQSREEAEYPDQ